MYLLCCHILRNVCRTMVPIASAAKSRTRATTLTEAWCAQSPFVSFSWRSRPWKSSFRCTCVHSKTAVTLIFPLLERNSCKKLLTGKLFSFHQLTVTKGHAAGRDLQELRSHIPAAFGTVAPSISPVASGTLFCALFFRTFL